MTRKRFVASIVTAFVKHMEEEYRKRPSRDDGLYIQGATEMAARMIVELCGGSKDVIANQLLCRKEVSRAPADQINILSKTILYHIDHSHEPRRFDI